MAAPAPNPPSRSPSPTEPAPVALHPGPRASKLSTVFSEALAASLRTCNYSNFSKCFPTPAEKTPKVLKAVHEQIVGKIQTKANTEFAQIMQERNVVEGLNRLEGLIQEGKRRREVLVQNGEAENVVPAHELPATELYNAHLVPVLEPLQNQLKEQLEESQNRNTQLAEQIRRQREEMEKIVGGLEAAVRDLEGANKVLEEATVRE